MRPVARHRHVHGNATTLLQSLYSVGLLPWPHHMCRPDGVCGRDVTTAPQASHTIPDGVAEHAGLQVALHDMRNMRQALHIFDHHAEEVFQVLLP